MYEKNEYKNMYNKCDKVENYKNIFSIDVEQVIHQLEVYSISSLIDCNDIKISDSKILDAPCGFGRISMFLESYNPKQISGIDSSESMVEESKNNVKSGSFVSADLSQIPFDNECFDISICFRFLMNLKRKDRIKVLSELNRVIKGKGYLICNIHLNKYSFRGIETYIMGKIKGYFQPHLSFR